MLSFCDNMRNASENYKKMPLFTHLIGKDFFGSSITHRVDKDAEETCR